MTKNCAILAMTALVCGCPRYPAQLPQIVSPCLTLAAADRLDGEASLAKLLATDFAQKDQDKNGILTLKEANQLRPKAPHIIDRDIFAILDDADTGELKSADVTSMAKRLYDWASFYRQQFLDSFDTNRDRVLSLPEVAKRLSVDAATFKTADTDGNGTLNATEFLNLVLFQNETSGCIPRDTPTSTTNSR